MKQKKLIQLVELELKEDKSFKKKLKKTIKEHSKTQKALKEFVEKRIPNTKSYNDNESDLNKVKRNSSNIKDIPNPSEEVCLLAVRDYGMNLQYITNPTEKVCLEAVKKNGFALEFVKNQTDEICIEAVKSQSDSLKFVEKQTDEICLAAVKKNVESLKHVKNQTEEMCIEAYKSDTYALKGIDVELLKNYDFVNKLSKINDDIISTSRISDDFKYKLIKDNNNLINHKTIMKGVVTPTLFKIISEDTELAHVIKLIEMTTSMHGSMRFGFHPFFMGH